MNHNDLHQKATAAGMRAVVAALFGGRPFGPDAAPLLAERYPLLNGLDDQAWSHLIAEMGAVQAMAADGWDFEAMVRLSAAINRLGIGADVHRLVADVIALDTTEDHR
ncbi:hypothetical protein [Glycomyces paridis]|uniref:Uncharacterized protein n=1 Tax=Glycomyces paridis TaxID=2126555 RepID=A0A4S8PGK2_9ACTN|nr:hypothetical protein [Glycomyces paridis]THV29647.1 hypothetical protein E9998_09190 [Glycomyces paridis]